MKKFLPNIVLTFAVLALLAGIALTYEKFRGTDLSRLPQHSGRHERVIAPEFSGSANTAPMVLASSDAVSRPINREGYRKNSIIPPYEQEGLTLYPTIEKGMRTPFDLWRYYGRGVTSFGSPVLPMRFDQWLDFHRKQKPTLMKDVHAYMESRFDFSGTSIPNKYMSGGKPIMKGPVAKLQGGVETFEELADISVAEIRLQDIFPYTPLAHPLQSTAHMVFPQEWVKVQIGRAHV